MVNGQQNIHVRRHRDGSRDRQTDSQTVTRKDVGERREGGRKEEMGMQRGTTERQGI